MAHVRLLLLGKGSVRAVGGGRHLVLRLKRMSVQYRMGG